MSQPDNIFTRMIARIDKAFPRLTTEEDRRVLTYVKGQISAEGQEARPAHDKPVDHLMQVAHQRLRPYEDRKVI